MSISNTPRVYSIFRAFLVDFTATAFVVAAGIATALATASNPGSGTYADVVAIAAAFAGAVTVTVAATGAHVNPAVTVAVVVRDTSLNSRHWPKLCARIVGQLVGGIAGAGVARSVMPIGSEPARALGRNALSATTTPFGALLGEAFFTALVVLAAVEVHQRHHDDFLTSVAVGVAVFVAHLVLVPVTGCSVNPARSIGPAVVTGDGTDLWVFVLGPMIGAVVAGFLGRFFRWLDAKADK